MGKQQIISRMPADSDEFHRAINGYACL